MGVNTFGDIYSFITFGESHGKAIGVVIDGCPPGIEICEKELRAALKKRAPGSLHTSPRKESDEGEFVSGIFEGKTTGAPLTYIVKNQDADSSKYYDIKDQFRPGHAHFTYLKKYGIWDYRGGGRASARETLGRVVAGYIAKKVLMRYEIKVGAYLSSLGPFCISGAIDNPWKAETSPIFCPDKEKEAEMIHALENVIKDGDSLGGSVAFFTSSLPIGLGDPVYRKLEAVLALAMMSIPASKGFEIGKGFESSTMLGSQHNDPFVLSDNQVVTEKNDAGGTLGGISSGSPIWGRVAFKPTSSIRKSQKSVDEKGREIEFNIPKGSRHDPCVAIRAVPVVEAMLACSLLDLLLRDRTIIR